MPGCEKINLKLTGADLVYGISRDIDIACQALIEGGFASVPPNDTFLCDVYHRPAHNNQNTIFARLYVSAGRLCAIYAKAVIFQLGWKITKESFEATKAANLHGGSEGHIVCGFRYLDSFAEEDIRKALREVVGLAIPDKRGFILDDEIYFVSSSAGKLQFFRSYANQTFAGIESIRLLMGLIDAISSNE